jgi:hypothetical protein
MRRSRMDPITAAILRDLDAVEERLEGPLTTEQRLRLNVRAEWHRQDLAAHEASKREVGE